MAVVNKCDRSFQPGQYWPKLSGTPMKQPGDRHKRQTVFIYSNQHHGKAMQDKLKELNAGVIRLYPLIAWLNNSRPIFYHGNGYGKVCRPAFLQVYFITLVSELFYRCPNFLSWYWSACSYYCYRFVLLASCYSKQSRTWVFDKKVILPQPKLQNLTACLHHMKRKRPMKWHWSQRRILSW